jgi:hypothetical protein
MNETTARRLCHPSYTPAQRMRIYNDLWYAVTLQDVEHNPMADYVGLADTQTTVILPGAEARRERDSHWNRCNAIAEYHGPVYQLEQPHRPPRWYPSQEAAWSEHQRIVADDRARLAEVEKSAIAYESAPADQHVQWCAQNCREYIARHQKPPAAVIRKVR